MEISLLHRLVLGESCLKLAALLLLRRDRDLRPCQCREHLIAPLVELRQFWIELADLTLDLADP